MFDGGVVRKNLAPKWCRLTEKIRTRAKPSGSTETNAAGATCHTEIEPKEMQCIFTWEGDILLWNSSGVFASGDVLF